MVGVPLTHFRCGDGFIVCRSVVLILLRSAGKDVADLVCTSVAEAAHYIHIAATPSHSTRPDFVKFFHPPITPFQQGEAERYFPSLGGVVVCPPSLVYGIRNIVLFHFLPRLADKLIHLVGIMLNRRYHPNIPDPKRGKTAQFLIMLSRAIPASASRAGFPPVAIADGSFRENRT